jgi:glutathione peroxidase
MNIYNISIQKTNGEEISLSQFKWKILLIVNTATKCWLTPQFEWLEKLWQDYKEKDFFVLWFPCNQFANQEPFSNWEMEEVCKINYWVTFPLFAKVEVNGENEHPLYTYLKSEKWGWFWDDIKWNFTKFLINREWEIVNRYAPTTEPSSIKDDIDKLI